MTVSTKCILQQGKCDLTYKEYELLKYLIMNEGIVLTRDRLMEEIWGMDFTGESRTLGYAY